MSQHKKKITVRVTSQTAFHIRETADLLGVTEGEVLDILMQAVQKAGGIKHLRGYKPRRSHAGSR